MVSFGRRRIHLIASLLSMLIVALPVGGAYGADAPQITARAQEEAQIRDFADRHVRSGGPMMTTLVIDIFRNNEGKMTPREIAETYERQYQNGKTSIWVFLGYPGLGWAAPAYCCLLLYCAKVLQAASSRHFRTYAPGPAFFWKPSLQTFRVEALPEQHNSAIRRAEAGVSTW
jgi:hypothetical protein